MASARTTLVLLLLQQQLPSASADLPALTALMTELEAMTVELVEAVETNYARRCDEAVVGRAVRLCLSVSLSPCLSVSLSLCLSASLPLCLSASLSHRRALGRARRVSVRAAVSN